MMRVEFHRRAAEEFLSAVESYESQSPGLGGSFASAVLRASTQVAEFPESGRPFGHRIRRVLVNGFPYGMLYNAEPNRIFVVAVAHLHRRPDYWRERA